MQWGKNVRRCKGLKRRYVRLSLYFIFTEHPLQRDDALIQLGIEEGRTKGIEEGRTKGIEEERAKWEEEKRQWEREKQALLARIPTDVDQSGVSVAA